MSSTARERSSRRTGPRPTPLPPIPPERRDNTLALTPAGTLYAYANAEPDGPQRLLQGVLGGEHLPTVQDWLDRSPEHGPVLYRGLSAGWLELMARRVTAPEVRLDGFISSVIAGLSGERKAALASHGGFCIGVAGYTAAEAEALCAAAADFSEYTRRQQARGWRAGAMVSFHDDIAMLLPQVSFVPFFIEDIDYCLVLGGEPLTNNPALVELVWGIKTSGSRFRRSMDAAPG